MKISVLTEKLKRGLGVAEKIIASKSTLPILNNVLLKTSGGQVVLSATDLEMGVNYYLGGKVETDGAITAPGRVLLNFVNSLSDEKVLLETKDNTLLINTDKSEADLNGISADDFPIIPEVKGEDVFEIGGSDLKAAIGQVAFAASFDESRPILTGVYFIVDKQVKLVATDSYRLAEKTISAAVKNPAKFIVPIKTIQELHRVISGNEKVVVVLSSNQVMFKLPDMELTSRIIEGEYPDYEQVIPKNLKTTATFATHELLNVVKAASFFAREDAHNIQMSFSDKGVEVTATSSQLGKFRSSVIGTVSGESVEISFNARYLTDALSNVASDSVTMQLAGKLSPGLIRPEADKSGVTYIIMPLKS